MTFEEVFADKYETISPLREDCGIWLLMERETKKILVGKILTVYDRDVYQQLLQLEDPHIISVKEISEQKEEGILYEVEAYISGETLEDRIRRDGPMRESEAGKWMISLCEALEVLHSQNRPIIHRDLKLSNVMITDDGVLKLIDFNASRNYEEGLQKDTRLIGTNGYAAPEQYGFAQSDARTDLYAAGVIFNYLLTGKAPGEELWNGRMGRVIEQCTQIDPKKRCQSAGELRTKIQKCLKKLQEDSQGKEEKTKRKKRTGTEDNGSVPDDRNKSAFWPLPGFRGRNPFVKVMAVFGYFMVFLLAGSITTEGGYGRNLVNKIGFGIMWLMEIAMFSDYGKISDYLPFFHSNSRFVRWSVKLIAAVLIVFLTGGLTGMVENFFP
ncbi:serine/threonine protein kinase [Brotaphodocola sp.]|uniref:serine/threonine protein kinase n=1 Tax=Brotaphodocola sp. TaxID=3073577 RepID=UPI003D7CD4B8